MNHLLATIALLIFSTVTAASSTNDHSKSPENTAPTYDEIKQMSQSIQKINALYLNCKMESECILSGLRAMVEKDKDTVAKSMLQELERQQKNDMSIMGKCYENEKSEVNNTLYLCRTLSKESQKDSVLAPCLETHLLALINQGNALAELTLLNLYKTQNDEKKINELKTKLGNNMREKGLKRLQQCLDSYNRK